MSLRTDEDVLSVGEVHLEDIGYSRIAAINKRLNLRLHVPAPWEKLLRWYEGHFGLSREAD